MTKRKKKYWGAIIAFICFAGLVGFFIKFTITRNPATEILGTWEEKDWSYEKFDGFLPRNQRMVDGINMRYYSHRDIMKHEFESWRFSEDSIYIVKEGKVIETAHWKLKGRGHILKILYSDGSFELYDVKELNDDELILNYDIGMEVRGIAKLEFKRKK